MINARPHPNGDTPKTFKDEGRAAYKAATTCLDEVREFATNLFHLRNYQHCDEPFSAREADLERMQKIIHSLDDLRDLSVEIFQRGE